MKGLCFFIVFVALLAGIARADSFGMPDQNLTFDYHGEEYFYLTISKNVSITNFTGNVTGYTVNSLGYAGQQENLSANGNIDPWGVTTDGTYFYVADRSGSKVFVYFLNWTYVSNFSINYWPFGITTDGTYLWIVDQTPNRVVRHFMNGTEIDSFPTFTGGQGCAAPFGITQDGSYFWVTRPDFVCKFIFPNGILVENYSANASTAIAINDSYLWIADFTNNYIHKYYKNGSYANTTYGAEENFMITGLIIDGDYFWASDSYNSRILANTLMDLYTKNMSIDTGDDDQIDVFIPGKINETYPIDLNADAINEYLYYGPCRYNYTCDVPFRVIVKRAGKLNFHDLTIYFQLDGDGDGIPDSIDDCPGTPLGALVHIDGCMVEVTEEINASEGGKVTNEANITEIEIPADALNEDQNISINATKDATGFGIKQGTELQGYIYEFNPSPLDFNQNVTVVMTYEGPSGLTEQEELDMFDIYYYNETSGEWIGQNASQNVTLDTLTMQIDHFSVFGIFVQIENPVEIESKINPDKLGLGGGEVKVKVRIVNMGEEKVSNAHVEIESADFGIYEESEKFDLDVLEKQKITFSITIPPVDEPGIYAIDTRIYEPKSDKYNTYRVFLEIINKTTGTGSTSKSGSNSQLPISTPTAGQTSNQEKDQESIEENQVIEDKTEEQEGKKQREGERLLTYSTSKPFYPTLS